MTPDSHEHEPEESTESGTRGRTITAGTIIVGTSGCIELSSGSVTRAIGNDDETAYEPVLVSMADYRPGMSFRIVSRLPAPITVELLRLPDGEFTPVLTQPDQYTGYVVRSTTGERRVDTTTNVFTEESLDPDVSYTFTTETQVFDTGLNLFESLVRYET